jgi:glycosyltransferase involved in cell wall biosynthesis
VILPARLLWDKGIKEFVEAAEIIKSKSINARFILVGSHDSHNPENIQSEVIDKWVNDGLVEYWGFSDDMPKIMREASIVCLPSYREGLPKVLIEAASCAKPIVTTDVPGCKEVVSHGLNGYLVKEREVKDLAIFLEKLILDKDLRHSMGQKGRKIVIDRFAEDLITKKTRKVWEEALL